MNEIFFPYQYKKALLNKTKNTTIRIRDEIGKYKVGKIYLAKSYAGRNWNIRIKILKVTLTTLNKFSDLGIPQKSIEAIQNNKKISFNEKVELILFEVFS
jgi:hypothetical protein